MFLKHLHHTCLEFSCRSHLWFEIIILKYLKLWSKGFSTVLLNRNNQSFWNYAFCHHFFRYFDFKTWLSILHKMLWGLSSSDKLLQTRQYHHDMNQAFLDDCIQKVGSIVPRSFPWLWILFQNTISFQVHFTTWSSQFPYSVWRTTGFLFLNLMMNLKLPELGESLLLFVAWNIYKKHSYLLQLWCCIVQK